MGFEKTYLVLLATLISLNVSAQDIIEREYFPGARAKNASIAAARYAEEGYYYTKFTTYINAVDSSRMFADTALFFIKRSEMLSDTALLYTPKVNYPAIDYLNSGRQKLYAADSVIRGYYPMVDINSHNIFGVDGGLHLSNSVMDFFNASLLLNSESNAPRNEEQRYEVLPYEDEIVRLEADEAAFQAAANEYEEEIDEYTVIAMDFNSRMEKAKDQRTKFSLSRRLEQVNRQIDNSTSGLQDASSRLEEIRQLLSEKYLSDVANVEEPEHISKFDKVDADEIEMDATVPDGLVYKIQLGYYPSDVDVDNFHGLFPISGETVKDDLVRIYAGVFFSFTDASKGKDYIRQSVIANAFIVPFHNGKKISISKAVEIERQRGVK